MSPRTPIRRPGVRGAAALALLTAGLVGCTAGPGGAPPAGATIAPTAGASSATAPAPPGSSPPTATPSARPTPLPSATLPPPPRPTAPAPSTAGSLTEDVLPVPRGWHTVVRAGGAEEGFQGNGTWVRGRDPRYAAQDAITLGCADVARTDWRDPRTALEGSYENAAGDPGIGLVLQFARAQDAERYFALYRRQVAACRDPDGPVVTRLEPAALGLVDRRTYPDGEWTEMARVRGRRLTLIVLTDPGHRISLARATAVLRSVSAG